MLDRESTFADPEIIKRLQTEFVPVAIDQAYQRRQKDNEGEFYRKIAVQGPRGDGSKGQTTQGLYIAAADGTLLGFTNHRSPDRVKKLIDTALKQFKPSETAPIPVGKTDPQYSSQPPAGGLVVRVHAKILGGYEPTENKWQKIFQSSVSRDNLWITHSEQQSIVDGQIPPAVQKRIARFHLVDNTRGEPPMWKKNEIKNIGFKLDGNKLTGSAVLGTSDGSRGYECQFFGFIETEHGKVTRFDVVAQGDFWGEGRYTTGAPKGRFPLAISFSMADGADTADAIPPQGSRGWVRGYLE